MAEHPEATRAFTQAVAPSFPASGAEDLTCEICGAQMTQRQCKITCPNCGFTRDCSDP